jgi:arylsulfatase A-like enzyme
MTPLFLLATSLIACSPSTPPTLPGVEAGPVGPTTLLARHPERMTELTLAPSSQTPGWSPQELLERELTDFAKGRQRGDVVEYTTRLPHRTAHYGQEQGRQPFGMQLLGSGGKPLKYSRSTKKARTWSLQDDALVVRLRDSDPAPEGFTLAYPEGAAAQADLSRDTSKLDNTAFTLRKLALEDTREHGVYLPAPSAAGWDIELPPRAWLSTRATLVPPVLGDSASDGATLVVEVDAPDGTHELHRAPLAVGEPTDVRVDLSTWAGTAVRLRLRTEAGASPTEDFVFLSEPAVYSPTPTPRRMVVIFVDTLRADRMGVYGHSRDTTPLLGEWAERAAVFETARAVSPWTLPSTRTMLTGREPDAWNDGPHLADQLGAAGWTSLAVVRNTWLAETFEMDRAFSTYRSQASANVEDQVASARRLLDAVPDRDAMVLLHVMDPHMPYEEPAPHRTLWAGDAPASLPDENVDENSTPPIFGKASRAEREAIRTYAMDRYDQNIHYIDAVLAPFVAELGDDAIVVLVSDHGEEFWEHGMLGHGFNLYEEAVRVPLIVAAPGLPASRITAPVSLMDLAPTLVELGGGTPHGAHGSSLVAAMRGDQGAAQALAARPLPLGRTSFRHDAWGVVVGGKKWVTADGHEEVYDLAADPHERTDLVPAGGVPLEPFHQALSEGLGGRTVHRALRISGIGSGASWKTAPSQVDLTSTGTFAAAWSRHSDKFELATPALSEDGHALQLSPGGGRGMPRESFVLPQGELPDLSLAAAWRGRVDRAATTEAIPAPDGTRQVLLSTGTGRDLIEITWAVQPAPIHQRITNLAGTEMSAELEALGYLDK